MRSLRNQSGVAMVTVLFIGAALTVIASASAFVTFKELRAGADDRRAAQALAYAEAGIDRMELEIKGGRWNWKQIMLSGCGDRDTLTVSGSVGNGTYSAIVRPQSAVVSPQTCDPPPTPRDIAETGELVVITSTGSQPTASRVIREVANLTPKGLPVGLYAKTAVKMNGNAGVTNVSLITPGSITGRDQIGFEGTDPWYTIGDFYPDHIDESDSRFDDPIPGAVHSGNLIYCQSFCPQTKSQIEHPYQPTSGGTLPYNCRANPRGTAGQSGWDGSNWTADPDQALIPNGTTCGSPPFTIAPTSLFTLADANRLAPQPELTEEDFRALKTMAQTNGIYCNILADNTKQCTKMGSPLTMTATGVQLLDAEVAGIPNQFVVYVEFAPGTNPKQFANNYVRWGGDKGACVDDADANVTGIVVVRNGSFQFMNGSELNGAIFAHQGKLDSNGTYSFNGTAIADEIEIISGADDSLDQCWVNNMPMPFLDITPVSWTEVDR
ncbi:MAG: hypothetical protein ACRDJJ_03630 [Actinomycetota bacterium]